MLNTTLYLKKSALFEKSAIVFCLIENFRIIFLFWDDFSLVTTVDIKKYTGVWFGFLAQVEKLSRHDIDLQGPR